MLGTGSSALVHGTRPAFRVPYKALFLTIPEVKDRDWQSTGSPAVVGAARPARFSALGHHIKQTSAILAIRGGARQMAPWLAACLI